MLSLFFIIACSLTDDESVEMERSGSNETDTKQNGQPNMGQHKPMMGSGIFKYDPPSSLENTTPEAICKDCDIIYISVCSLRKDHVGIYGKHPFLTPQIDSIGRNGFVFERAYAASNFTLAGLTAMLTGQFGSSTGVTGWDKGLSPTVKTLPEILSIYGYSTAAFTADSASGFRPDYGLNKGFLLMNIFPAPPGTPDGREMPGEVIPGASAIPMAKWILKQPKDKPIFAMLHSRTAHFPFVVHDKENKSDTTGVTQLLWDAGKAGDPNKKKALPGMAGGQNQKGVVAMQGPDPLAQKVSENPNEHMKVWKKRYREAVNRTDDDINVLLEAIEKRGNSDKTIIVFVADHGESLNDHGELLHGDAYFDGVTNVPLMFSVPKLNRGMVRIKHLISHVDIMPTLLDLIGATLPENIDGVSAVPLLQGIDSPIRSATLSEGGVARHNQENLPGAVIAPPWALLKQMRGCGGPNISRIRPDIGMPVCLYHLEKDPDQKNDVSSQHRDVVDKLMLKWTSFRQKRNDGKAVSMQLSPEFVSELQRTGYDFKPSKP